MKKKIILLVGLLGISNVWTMERKYYYNDFILSFGPESIFITDNSKSGVFYSLPNSSAGIPDLSLSGQGFAQYDNTTSVAKVISPNSFGYVVAGTTSTGQFLKFILTDGTLGKTINLSVANGSIRGLVYNDESDTVYVAILNTSTFMLYIYAYNIFGELVESFGTNGVASYSSIQGMTNNMIFSEKYLFIAINNGSEKEIYKIDTTTGTTTRSTDIGTLPYQIRIYNDYVYVIYTNTNHYIKRYALSDLTIDTDFGSSGTVDIAASTIAGDVADMIINDDGSLYFVTYLAANYTGYIAKLLNGTTLDTNGWGTNGIVTINGLGAFSLAGSFLLTFGAGSNGPFLYVYGDDDASGKRIWSLNGSGNFITDSNIVSKNPFTIAIGLSSSINSMIIDANQKLVLGGTVSSIGALWRYTSTSLLEEYFKANSKPDTAFGGGSAEGQTTTSN